MLSRVLEPEWMDDSAEAAAYDAMDHAEVNGRFVADLIAGGAVGPDVLDLGTGTGLIPLALCASLPEVRVMALDASASMLDLAVYHVEVAGRNDRVQLVQGDAKRLEGMADGMFDTVISNSLLHHLPDPGAALAEALRVVKPGGRLFFRDLTRPDDTDALERLVAQYAGEEEPAARQLLRQSLHAALTLDEIRTIAAELGLDPGAVQATSDRHWTLDVREGGKGEGAM